MKLQRIGDWTVNSNSNSCTCHHVLLRYRSGTISGGCWNVWLSLNRHNTMTKVEKNTTIRHSVFCLFEQCHKTTHVGHRYTSTRSQILNWLWLLCTPTGPFLSTPCTAAKPNSAGGLISLAKKWAPLQDSFHQLYPTSVTGLVLHTCAPSLVSPLAPVTCPM